MFGNLHPSFTFGFYSGEITETESFSFIANFKIIFFYSTSGKFTKNNHPCGSVYSMAYLSVRCGELCLQMCLSVCWLEVMFAIGFVCLLIFGHVITYFFISRDGVSVGLFHYRFNAIQWILNYKWADYWPYWEFIYLFFLCGLLLLCVLPWVICFMFGVVWVLGFFFFIL